MTHERRHEHARSTPAPVEHVADLAPGRVLRSAGLLAPEQPLASRLIQRAAQGGGAAHGEARDGNGVAGDAEAAVAAAGGSGAPLSEAVRGTFEASLGSDLSAVRVHTGERSAAAAHALGARAYTIGQDIHFGAGQYDPGSAAGRHLLAHEVAHTVQQRGGAPVRQHKLEVSSPIDAAEHEADRAADAMVAGRPAVLSALPGSAARAVLRDAAPPDQAPAQAGQAPAPQLDAVNPKFTFELPELKMDDWKAGKYVIISPSIKAKVSVEVMRLDDKGNPIDARVAAGAVSAAPPAAAGGVQAELMIAQQSFRTALLGMTLDHRIKEKATFQLTTAKLKVAVGAEYRVAWEKLPWLRGAVDGTFELANISWEDLQKDPAKMKIIALTFAGGFNGEGPYIDRATQRAFKGSVTVQVNLSASPNWKEILAEALKNGVGRAATGAATGAGTAAAGGTAAVATEAAVLTPAYGGIAASASAGILPLGVAALMVAGAVQTEKNVRASKAAVASGVKLRNEAIAYARNFARTITGGEGTGPGAVDAEARLNAYMAASGKDRAAAGADFAAQNGGRAAIEAAILQRIRDQLFDRAVAEFERQYAAEFGLVESIGENWGMRGVFRRELRGILYSDTAAPA